MNLQGLTAQVDRVRAAAPAQQQSVEDDMLAVSEISDPIKLTEALRDLDQAIADGAAAAERVIRQSEGQQLTLHVSRLQRVFITTKNWIFHCWPSFTKSILVLTSDGESFLCSGALVPNPARCREAHALIKELGDGWYRSSM